MSKENEEGETNLDGVRWINITLQHNVELIEH